MSRARTRDGTHVAPASLPVSGYPPILLRAGIRPPDGVCAQDFPHDAEPGDRIQQKGFDRASLRALNGVAIGIFLGAPLGGALGAFSAMVFLLAMVDDGAEINAAPLGAYVGLFLGLLAGGFVGGTVVIRDDRRRASWAAAIGFFAALPIAVPSIASASLPGLALGIIALAGGIVCGRFGAACMGAIRRRWSWWSRWEEHE